MNRGGKAEAQGPTLRLPGNPGEEKNHALSVGKRNRDKTRKKRQAAERQRQARQSRGHHERERRPEKSTLIGRPNENHAKKNVGESGGRRKKTLGEKMTTDVRDGKLDRKRLMGGVETMRSTIAGEGNCALGGEEPTEGRC